MTKETRKWMPMFWPEYLADTGHLNAAEHGAYMLLIAHYWMRGGLPEDEKIIARITRMTPRQWRKSRDLLRSLFGDHWRHQRVDIELAYAAEKSRVMSANALLRHSRGSAEAYTPTPTPGIESKKEVNGHREGKKGKPRHGAFTKDRKRVWFDRGTPEWESYANDYAAQHHGMCPPTQWNGTGSWFNWCGEETVGH